VEAAQAVWGDKAMSQKTETARAQDRREDQEEMFKRFEQLSGKALQSTLAEDARAKELRAGMTAVGGVDEDTEEIKARALARAKGRFQALQGGQSAASDNLEPLIEEGAEQIGTVRSAELGVEEQDPGRAELRQHDLPCDEEFQQVRRGLQLSEIRAGGALESAAAQVGELTRDAIRNIGNGVVLSALGTVYDEVAGVAARAVGGAAEALGADEDVAEMAKKVADFALRKGVKPALLASVAASLGGTVAA